MIQLGKDKGVRFASLQPLDPTKIPGLIRLKWAKAEYVYPSGGSGIPPASPGDRVESVTDAAGFASDLAGGGGALGPTFQANGLQYDIVGTQFLQVNDASASGIQLPITGWFVGSIPDSTENMTFLSGLVSNSALGVIGVQSGSPFIADDSFNQASGNQTTASGLFLLRFNIDASGNWSINITGAGEVTGSGITGPFTLSQTGYSLFIGATSSVDNRDLFHAIAAANYVPGSSVDNAMLAWLADPNPATGSGIGVTL